MLRGFPGTAVFLMIFGAGIVTLFASEHRPSALFVQRCAKCHGEDGHAGTAKGRKLKAQDFTDLDFQQHKTDQQLLEAVTNGTDKDMPLFGKILTAAQIESLVKEDVRGFGRQ